MRPINVMVMLIVVVGDCALPRGLGILAVSAEPVLHAALIGREFIIMKLALQGMKELVIGKVTAGCLDSVIYSW